MGKGSLVIALASFVLLSACAQKAYFTSPTLDRGGEQHRIVLMPLDIELSIVHAGGMHEPRADWTEQGKTHVRQALYDKLAGFDARLIYSEEIDGFGDLDQKQVQLIKLHGAVGRSILTYQYNPALKLPTKGDRFDWTLGPEARLLKDKFGADYALFVHLRDSYSSAGRIAVIVISAVLFGAPIQGGTQVGFASLVDLESGKIVWFNRIARGTGDLRTADAASGSVDALLQSFPQ